MKVLNRLLNANILMVVLCLPLTACETSSFSYVAREQLGSEQLYLIGKSDIHKEKNYGAVKLQSVDADANEGRLFLLQKKKGVYRAETMFHQKNDKKYYFSLGMDYKDKTPVVGFRMEF